MRSLVLATVLLAVVPLTATAQPGEGATTAERNMERGRQMVRAGRAELIRDELQMSEAESQRFWPLYEAYRAEADAVMDRYAAMITEYMRRYNEADLSDEYADELVDNFFAIKKEVLDVQMAYLPKFREILPGLKVARFFQLENKTNAEIEAQLALVVPLADPS